MESEIQCSHCHVCLIASLLSVRLITLIDKLQVTISTTDAGLDQGPAISAILEDVDDCAELFERLCQLPSKIPI